MTSPRELVSQAEFSRLLGVARSWITKLKADGRLVMTEEGAVDVEASKQRILDTADPNRDDVVTRWAKERGAAAVAPESKPAAPEGQLDDGDEDRPSSYASARARKENAAADIAEMERDKLRGLLIERIAVEAAVEDIMTTVRQHLEQMPHRVAPLLVGKDLDAVRATLKQETAGTLAGMVKEFQQRLRQMAGEEN